MNSTALQEAFDLNGRSPVDRWLNFAEPIQARYDESHAAARVRDLRSAIFVGLLLYNVYNVTSVVLLADSFALSVALRLLLITPTSLALAWLIGQTSPLWTERLVTVGILNAYFVPVFLFWFSNEPFSLFTFGELPLTIIFACMLLPLRFPNAVVFTLGVWAVTVAAVATKTGLEPSLAFAFTVQITTACVFALYANYRHESRRCSDFLVVMSAMVEARKSEASSLTYRDQSRTDALTQLPNRRHLTERLESWLSDDRAVSVMMIDIDHFKLYNDALGHPCGDDCLQRVAQVFSKIAAESGEAFCARFGGEEFTFVLAGSGELEAARVAKAILGDVSSLAIPHPSRSDGIGIVTVSIGVALTESGQHRQLVDILAAADRALYSAKRRGRNRFAIDEGPEQSERAGG